MPEEVKGGSANSPCIGCPSNRKDGTCSKYFRNCEKYAAWIDKCWKDFQKAAEELRRKSDESLHSR